MQRNVSPEDWRNGTVDVTLEDGTKYEKCDYPNEIFSDTTPSLVSFWHAGRLHCIPLDLVNSVIFNPPA